MLYGDPATLGAMSTNEFLRRVRDGDEVRAKGGVHLPPLRADEVYVISVVVPGGGVARIETKRMNERI